MSEPVESRPEVEIEGELARPAIEFLFCAIATLLEWADADAVEIVTRSEAEMRRAARLSRVGQDVAALAAAIEVLARRMGPVSPEPADD
jgi:hypothetical protein